MSTLLRGDEEPSVLSLQQLLLALRAPLADPPGHFGLWTEASVFVLQHCAGIEPDGIYGPQTAEILTSGNLPPGFAELIGNPLRVLAGVPYKSQRDNEHDPNSTCNVTALAMAMDYLGVSRNDPAAQLEDELFELIRSPSGIAYYQRTSPDLFQKGVPANQVYDNLVWAAEQYGLRATFSGKRRWQEIAQQVHAGRPVLLSTTLTSSGHIVLLVGLTATGDLVCHDPYGDFKRGYKSKAGAFRIYPKRCVAEHLKEVHSDEKWALFVDPLT